MTTCPEQSNVRPTADRDQSLNGFEGWRCADATIYVTQVKRFGTHRRTPVSL